MKLNINLILTIIFVLIVANFLCDSFREGALFKPTLSRNNWGHEDLTKKQIEKYFGPLKRGPPKENLSKKADGGGSGGSGGSGGGSGKRSSGMGRFGTGFNKPGSDGDESDNSDDGDDTDDTEVSKNSFVGGMANPLQYFWQ